MIAGLRLYSEYKDSQEAWLGRIPMHWDIRPAFGAYRPNREKNIGLKEKVVLSLSYGRIIIKPPEKLHGLVPESFETYQIVNPGDIVIRTTDLQNDHTSLRVAIARNRGIITSAYLALHVLDDVDPNYGYQVLNVWDLTKTIYGYGSGLRQNLDFRHFKRMLVAVPPLEEQASIIRFVNHFNDRVDRTIRAKRKIIALLNEQKQAIIHRAVTRGLEPNVPLKPSGIPWIGEIPKHWELKPNRAFLKLRKKIVGDRHKDFTLLSLTLRGVIARDMDSGKGKWPASFRSYQAVECGDLIFCLFDIDETPRFVGFSELPGMITGAYTVFRCQDKELARYVFFFYLAMDHHKSLKPAYTGLRKVIQKSTFLGIKTPMPPRLEREQILAAVKAKTKNIDLSITRLEKEIELLREYRTRLVADVVTGKLDVRKAAETLPEELDASDTFIAEIEDEEVDLENAGVESKNVD